MQAGLVLLVPPAVRGSAETRSAERKQAPSSAGARARGQPGGREARLVAIETFPSTHCLHAEGPVTAPWQGALVGSPPVSEDPKSQKLIYTWCNVGVLDYDKEKKLYLVHKTDEGGLVRDEMGKPILNGGITAEGMSSLPWF